MDDALSAAFERLSVPAALVQDGRVLRANGALGRLAGRPAAACAGEPVSALLPAGSQLRGGPDGPGPWLGLVHPSTAPGDPGTARALLELTRGLAQSHAHGDVAAALDGALASLFPGRFRSIRTLDPKTLAPVETLLSAPVAGGGLPPVSLRRAAVLQAGLPEGALRSFGLRIVDEDVPCCAGSARAVAVPLAAGSQLLGVASLEYPPGAPGDPSLDEPLLVQVATPAAMALRNVRSVAEVTFLKNWLEELLENANALILVTNRQHHVQLFNRALSRVTGVRVEDALGADVLALLPLAERDRALGVLRRGIDGEAVTGFETRLAVRGGGEALVTFHTAPIVGHGGEVEGVIAIGQDLTALRAMERRAEHFQRLAAVGQVAAGIVHELNNPLVAVVTYSDHLLERRRGRELDPGDAEKLRRIRDAGERIQRLARDLTTYARPSADNPEPLDLAVLLDQAARMCDPALREARARILQEFAPAPLVTGGRAGLLQVFVNLITNAAQALPAEGGTVRLVLEDGGDELVARVQDDGKGMPPEVQARVFEPFYSTKEGGRGVGLGLSIVHGIVARHGGSIQVESEPGRGTTFSVRLPLSGPPDQVTMERTP